TMTWTLGNAHNWALGAVALMSSTSSSSPNSAPVLSGANNFTTITEDQTSNNGDLVSTIISGMVTDANAGDPQGIGLTALNSSTGTWQYSLDGGTSWSAVGAVSDTSALLLRSTDRLRFVPDGINGTTASVTFRAWDQSSGSAGAMVDVSINGGTTAFSIASAPANLTVTSVNDAPVNTLPGAQSTNFNTPLTLSGASALSVSDVDSNPLQVTLTAANGTVTLSGIAGLMFSIGDGTADASMTFIGTAAN